MWERWNGDQVLGDPGRSSFHHYAYGAVAEWLYRYVAGIDSDPQQTGFHHLSLHPQLQLRQDRLEEDIARNITLRTNPSTPREVMVLSGGRMLEVPLTAKLRHNGDLASRGLMRSIPL